MRLRWWSRQSPTGAERGVFNQLMEIGQKCELPETCGADLSWFVQQRKSGGYRPVTSIYTNGVDLTSGGGIVCSQTHAIGQRIAAYLRYRQTHRWVQYADDPINCFFAELLGCLSTISLLGYTGDLDMLLVTVERRLNYLSDVEARSVFPRGIFSSSKAPRKDLVIKDILSEFGQMRRNIVEARTHVTLVQSVRVLDNTLTSFHHRTLAFTSRALCLDDDALAPRTVSGGGGRLALRDRDAASVVGTSDGEALADVAPVVSADGCGPRPGTVNSLRRLFYVVHTLAECTNRIGAVLGAVDSGGVPLVLGTADQPMCEWVRLNLAILDETIGCIESCKPIANEVDPTDDDLLTGSDPEASSLLAVRSHLERTLALLLLTSDRIRGQSRAFIQAMHGRIAPKGVREAIEKLRELTERTVDMFGKVATDLDMADVTTM
eukprot:m.140580 g.140580  ORF g.140580 m.140580 type:complete len:435 (+) comp14037_c0_seq4:5656-6960(+)